MVALAHPYYQSTSTYPNTLAVITRQSPSVEAYVQTSYPSTMSQNTPDNLLKLAADLNKLGGELSAIGGKLAAAATALEQEAANVAFANAQRWGVDVQVRDFNLLNTCLLSCLLAWSGRTYLVLTTCAGRC